MASLFYLVFCLCLHACTGRLLMVWDRETFGRFQLSNKDVKASVAERFVAYDNLRTRQGESIMRLDNNQKSSSFKEGKTIEIAHSWKILQQETGTKISERAERSMLESPPSNTEENVSSKDNGMVEDVVVMDYAQPHRKPPIHNRGT